jgi:hypothetical protein
LSSLPQHDDASEREIEIRDENIGCIRPLQIMRADNSIILVSLGQSRSPSVEHDELEGKNGI